MIWSAMQINRRGCHPPRWLAYIILHIIRKPHSIFYYSFKICKFLTSLPPRRLSANHLPLSYPGCQRLFMRSFRFRSSLKKWPARKVFSRGFAAPVFGLRPTKRSSPSHARKNLWYPGYLFLGTVSEFTEDDYLADTPQNVDDIHRALFWRILAFVHSVLIKNSAFSRLRIAINSSDIFLKNTFASTSRLPRRCLKTRLLLYFGTISHTFTFRIR